VSEGRQPSPPPLLSGPAVPGPIIAGPVPPSDTVADAISCASNLSILPTLGRDTGEPPRGNIERQAARPVSRTSRAAAARSTIDRPSRQHPGPRIRIVGTDEIAAALDSAGLRSDRALIVLVGGAGGMGEKEFETVAQVLPDEVVPVAERRDAVVIDGDTESGVEQLIDGHGPRWAVDSRQHRAARG
jgi:hypothetical protein